MRGCLTACSCSSGLLGVRVCAGVLLASVSGFSEEFVQDLGESSVYGVASENVKPLQASSSYAEVLPEVWEGRSLSAAEVLASLPGVQYTRQGGVGSFQTVSIRGISAKNIVVCMDGIPLNDASGGAVDFGSIDLNQVEKIEVYKDRVPAKFGGRGIGGAINFVTKGSKPAEAVLKPEDKKSGRVLLSYGSHNTWEASTQLLSRLTDSASVSASLSARHSDNDYEFDSQNGTPYNPNDDFKDTRRNAEFTEYSGLFKARVLHTNGVFSTLNMNFSRSEGGNPGRDDYQTSVAGYKGEFAQATYRAELPQLLGWLWLEMSLTGKFEKATSHSYYPLDHLGYDLPGLQEYGSAGYSLVPEVVANYSGDRLNANLRMSLDASYYEKRGTTSSKWNLARVATNVSFDVEYDFVKNLTVGGEASALIVKDDLHGGKFVHPTASKTLKSAKDRNVSWTGRGFLRYDAPDSRYGGNVSFGRFVRTPQLMELYGVHPGMLSNPDLKDESALRFEVGGYYMIPKSNTAIRATYFETDVENGIYWLVSGGFSKPQNIGKSHVRGFEAELESKPKKWLSVILRATFQDAEDGSKEKYYTGKKLPNEPARSYYAEARFDLPYHLDLTWTSEYRTEIFDDRANRIKQPAVDLHHVSLGYTPFEKTRLVFALRNLTDETYRNPYVPFPTPGREYKLTLTQGF
ncbi:TonB-dependent receptor plug domain-containing protein [Fibrobacter sp. UBA4297]|uniref:TonB-dependent receptor n=1 Tax=Fibrobacter sp. UBA4297 TaxID=1946536 RepID=UPI0025BF0396|nr:TonB-dependent receptor plug domain-containing protein [Fibrobacter sp. UBA4297]